MAELEELEDVAAGLGEARLALGPEDGEAGDGEADEGLELGRPVGSTQEPIQLPPHLSSAPGGGGGDVTRSRAGGPTDGRREKGARERDCT